MHPRLQYSASNCTVAAALSVVGQKWTLQVLRECFYGLSRFEDLAVATGCARNVLSSRLAQLVDHRLLDRVPYRDDGQRERFEYRLTERARELYPVLVALMQWGDRWLVGREGPPVALSHRGCGAAVRAELRCADGHGPLSDREIDALPGPGVRRAPLRRAR